MSRSLIAGLVLAAGTLPATAQEFPAKPVRVIIPFAAGGPADFLTRLMGPKLGEAWKQPVVIDNRGGGNQILGTELAAKAQPDGHTLLVTTGGSAVNVSLYPRAVDAPDVRERMLNQGMDPTTITPGEFSAHIRSEIAKWAKVVKASGAKAE